jgi:ATP-dependent Clp protease adaptor protein ClpS
MNELPGTQSGSELEEEVIDDVRTTEPARAILFNDEVHTFEEVISQIIKALRCDRGKAERLTLEVHTQGRSCVYSGDLKRCLEITHVLEEIQLMTQIEM